MLLGHTLDLERNARAHTGDAAHIAATRAWLERAQDAATDGGIMGRYRLNTGWTSSYPETTGYLVPTLLDIAHETGDARWIERARRAIDFLLNLQLPEGAFPGGEVHEGTTRASIFNTAQILNGLTGWHRHSGDTRTEQALRRAADWLCDMQDEDGAWRRHIYNGLVTTYTTHASCWLAEAGAHLGEARYLKAAERHMDWALTHRDAATGWIDLMGFSPADHEARRSVTHTIAYTYWGLLLTAELNGREDVIDQVQFAAEGIARRAQLSHGLPGVLDHRWRGQAHYVCLTGNAQMALIWLRLYTLRGDGRFLNAALIALDQIKAAQSLDNTNPGIRGAIAGSWPVWGGYINNAFPNWAAKFFLDAMRAADAALSAVPSRAATPVSDDALPSTAIPDHPSTGSSSVRVVLLAGANTHKVAQMCAKWSAFGFRPTAVVVERPTPGSRMSRIQRRIRAEGTGWLLSKFTGSSATGGSSAPTGDAVGWETDVVAYCTKQGIPVHVVDALASDAGVETLRGLAPDLCIHAGAGIMRAATLAVPKLGTLNAHMGRLPMYRGMNVVEWSVFNRDTTGCSVHLIDPGIDTGAVIEATTVDTSSARSLAEARRLVDEAQIARLGRVLAHVLATGALPATTSQQGVSGRQFYRMHPRLRAVLDAELAARK